MHLKSLTLRGFKSFASATTLRFEPGITAVVGPNGSGKSNVVDAISWVLGEQGAKSLRGGKMEDVIFAGTPGRAPLGRAEVVLTIDNSDGALPIDYAEVTISRLMYRSGSSEYAINGSACRLLDVQELLSDSGIGRELHVIVGQGSLDTVLSGRPEDRRAFIEEAAGTRKHLRRKEKALRKLDAMQANLTRVADLTAELRRQLGPLGRQAEVARRAADVQATLRQARLELLAAELLDLRARLDGDLSAEADARDRRSALEEAVAAAGAEESGLEAAAAAAAPRLAEAANTYYRLAGSAERLRGTVRLAQERLRHLGGEPDPVPAERDPAALEEEAGRLAAVERELTEATAEHRRTLEAAVADRSSAEAAAAEEERRLVRAARAVADRREGLARLTGQVAAARSRLAAAEAEAGRLAAAVDEAAARRRSAEADFTALEADLAGLDRGEVDLDADHEAAAAAAGQARERLAELVEAERALQGEVAVLAARQAALAASLGAADGTSAVLTAGLPGVLGSLADHVRAVPGADHLLAAALGAVFEDLADGVLVASAGAAAEAFGWLSGSDRGRVGVVLAGPGPSGDPGPAPAGTRWAAGLVAGDDDAAGAVRGALAGVLVADDEQVAAGAARGHLRVVAPGGTVFAAGAARGGGAAGRSRLETQGALDEVATDQQACARRAEQQRFARAGAEAALAAAEEQAEATLARLHDSDARQAAVAERLAELAAASRAAGAEADRWRQTADRVAGDRERAERTVAELVDRLAAAEAAPVEADPDPAHRDALAGAATAARAAELDARLALRTGEERLRSTAGRVAELRSAASRARAAAAAAAERARIRARRADRARAVADGGTGVLAVIEQVLERAQRARQTAEAGRTDRERALGAVRARRRELAQELEELSGALHRDELARSELRLRIEALEARSQADFGVPPETLAAEYGEAAGADRAELAERAAKAERALARLGRINPLALEEFAALEERHSFLTTQLADLEASRRDLLSVVREVDERVVQAFTSAFADTAREFEKVFGTLFPGGSGRLVLTDPDNPLTTGVEVEARPAGKRVSRLSLLSGGERSLTAIAVLVAIFRARPSPFYVLDEVEAALDDRNLGRLVGLMTELQSSSQLIVITHHTRTMEAADALYGVSMRGDGVTTVISQRLRTRSAEPGVIDLERDPAPVG